MDRSQAARHKGQQRDSSASVSLKVIRHRENEKQRHQNMTTALEQLQEYVPGQPDRETQINSLFRVARYVIFLKKIDAQRDSVTQSQLPAIYQSCEADVGQLNLIYEQNEG